MSYFFQTLIESNSGLETFVPVIEEVLGPGMRRFEAEADKPYYELQIIWINVTLLKNPGFEEDAGIHFERYPTIINFDYNARGSEGEYYRELAKVLAILVARSVSQRWKIKCLVVEDLHALIHTT